MIPITSAAPTILKPLYFFSHLWALDPDPHPELNSEGNAIHLRSAAKTTDKASKIPDPNYVQPQPTALPPATFEKRPPSSATVPGAFSPGNSSSRYCQSHFTWIQRMARNIDQWPHHRLHKIVGQMEIPGILFRARGICVLPPLRPLGHGYPQLSHLRSLLSNFEVSSHSPVMWANVVSDVEPDQIYPRSAGT
jgi:hypothetical protein